MDSFLQELDNESFTRVKPKDYASELKIKFLKNPTLWYNVISPQVKAEALIEETKNDYSLIWDEHCANCFCTINKDTKIDCFVSDDELTWLCGECFEKLKNQLHFRIKKRQK